MFLTKSPFFCLVHRIGRTGRSGNTGIATTFINKSCGKYIVCGHWTSLGDFLYGYGVLQFIITNVPFRRTDESVLMDLKALLLEAKQRVPPVLQVLNNSDETMLDISGEQSQTSPLIFSELCIHTFVIVFSISTLGTAYITLTLNIWGLNGVITLP